MNLTLRLYRDEEDYWRIRAFLREVYLLNNRLEKSWQVYRFDYCRWHVFMNISHNKLEEAVALWETADGRVAGVVNPEGTGEIFIQAHPGYQTPELEEEMIEFAEKTYTKNRTQRPAHFANMDSRGRLDSPKHSTCPWL